jgi:hypothetical protein
VKRNKLSALAPLVFASIVARPAAAIDPNDKLLVPLRVHLLAAKGVPEITTTLTDKDVTRILHKINLVWAPAGLHFYLESVVNEEAANPEAFLAHKGAAERLGLLSLRPEESKVSTLFHVYYLKRMSVNGIYLGDAIFVKDTASLRAVAGGIDEPLPRVTSHELGHAFGLPHRQDITNLMASGTTGIELNDEEIQRVRERAKKFGWIESAGALKRRVEELVRAGKIAEAEVLRRRLAGSPAAAQ